MIETKFKDTEVGRIPEDWDVKPLADIGNFSKGAGISRAEALSGNIPAIRYGEIYTCHNDYIKSFHSFISQSVAESSVKIFNGDILFAASGETKEEIGKSVAYTECETAFAGGDIIILHSDTEKFDAKFCGYALNARCVIKQKAQRGQGDAVVHIVPRDLATILFAFPAKSEQTRIATALSNIDALISELGKLIEKKRAIKQGAMQQFLTGKKRLKGFSEPWVEIKLGDCANVLYGFLFTPDYYTKTGKYKVATIGNVQEGKFYPDGCNNVNISSSFLNDYQYLKPGDLLISMTGNVGRVCIINAENYVMNYRVGKIVVNSDLCLQLLFHLLNQKGFIEDMLNKAKGAAQLNISKDDILSYSFLCPKSISEQTAIASVLSSMDEEISSLEAKREKYASIKQGMMQQLLTGKIRLID